MTAPTAAPAPRNRRTPGRVPRFTTPAMALVGVAALLVFAAPLAQSLGVAQLNAPFSGTPFQTVAYYHQGCGVNLVAHDLLFQTKAGKANLNQESRAKMCKGTANVLSIFQTTTNTGMNSSAFTPVGGVELSHEKIRWGLTYNWYMGTTWGNSSQTTYASFSVEVLGTIYDTTNGTAYPSTNSYSTGVTLSDTNATSLNHITTAPAYLYFNVSMSATHSYVFNTSLRVVTTVDTDGPGSAAFSEVLFYDPTLSDRATLNWLIY
ncbi:MAG: hypothetical protein L3K01_03505 [Thermoplasmata archaeon]|nr:hypothetical protein [Thermoplasmata archaeon]